MYIIYVFTKLVFNGCIFIFQKNVVNQLRYLSLVQRIEIIKLQ